jgi:uncharacterized protein
MVSFPTLYPKAVALALLLVLHGAGKDCNLAYARVQAQPGVGYSTPNLEPQDTGPVQTQLTMAERDIALLKERAERPSNTAAGKMSSALSNGRNLPAQKLDMGPIGSGADSAWLLGLIYAHGAGVAVDLAQAQLWFEHALENGQALGAAGLAWCALEACSRPLNASQARTYIAILKKTHAARALYFEWLSESKLAPFQLAASVDSTPSDRSASDLVARNTLIQSARLGDIHAQIELGLDSLAAQRVPQARSYFQSASTTSAAAAHNLRLLDMQQSNTAKQNNTPPINYAHMDASALLSAARRNHQGSGLPANYVEAIRLYRMAEAKGSSAARDMLALIFSRTTSTGEVDLAWIQRLAQIEVSGPTPSYQALGTQLFQRERTPLFDYLPELWKARIEKVY